MVLQKIDSQVLGIGIPIVDHQLLTRVDVPFGEIEDPTLAGGIDNVFLELVSWAVNPPHPVGCGEVVGIDVVAVMAIATNLQWIITSFSIFFLLFDIIYYIK